MQLLFQFLVLGFTVYVWWLARRDLAARAAETQAPALQEWDGLRETVTALIADLERRAMAAEQRVTEAEARAGEAERRLRLATRDEGPPPPSVAAPLGQDMLAVGRPALATPADLSEPPPVSQAEQAAHQARYAPVYALTASGITDAGEIARRTGLGLGEVELVLGLQGRRSQL